MRKLFFLLLVFLFIPMTVFAETCNSDGITINSIEVIEKSEGTKELSAAKAHGSNLDLDISFTREKDYIRYKMIIKNNTEDDYILNESMVNKKYNNVSYDFETDSKLVKAGSTREIILKVELTSNPEGSHFSDTNTISLDLTGGKVENPPTGVKNLLYFIPVLIIIGFIVVFAAKKKTSFKVMLLLIGLLISIPVIVKAVCKCNIKINSTITVSNCEIKLITDEGSFEEGKEVREICVGANEVIDSSEMMCKGFGSSSGGMAEAKDASLADYAFIFIYSRDYDSREELFVDSSYIKVYSDENKRNLVKTITKADINEHYYNLEYDMYMDVYAIIPIGKYEELYLTLSRDLRGTISYYVEHLPYSEYKEDTCPAGYPIITGKGIIDKINYLVETYETSELEFEGFSNCKDREGNYVSKSRRVVRNVTDSTVFRSQNRQMELDTVTPLLIYEPEITCSGNEYHAVWYTYTVNYIY